MFITYQMEKFREKGKCDKHSGGNGQPATPGRTVGRTKQLMLNKKKRSTRTVAAKLKLGQSTIVKLMKDNNIKAFHKRKVQGMKPDHKVDRFRFARWVLMQMSGLSRMFGLSKIRLRSQNLSIRRHRGKS